MNLFLQKSIGVLSILVVLLILACRPAESTYEKIEPAQVEHIEGSDLSTLTLTEKAAARTDIKTDIVREQTGQKQPQRVIPYSAILYGPNGKIWVYTNPKPLVYVRHEIKVDSIDGDRAVLLDGPPTGTAVVSQGAAELYGTEYHVGH